MAVHESGDGERRTIGPLLGPGEGILKQKAAPSFLTQGKHQLVHQMVHMEGSGV